MESVSGMRSPPVPSVSSACALISLIWAYFIVLLICQFSHSEICEQVSIISVAFIAHVDCQFFILKFWTNCPMKLLLQISVLLPGTERNSDEQLILDRWQVKKVIKELTPDTDTSK